MNEVFPVNFLQVILLVHNTTDTWKSQSLHYALQIFVSVFSKILLKDFLSHFYAGDIVHSSNGRPRIPLSTR